MELSLQRVEIDESIRFSKSHILIEKQVIVTIALRAYTFRHAYQHTYHGVLRCPKAHSVAYTQIGEECIYMSKYCTVQRIDVTDTVHHVSPALISHIKFLTHSLTKIPTRIIRFHEKLSNQSDPRS